MKKINELKGDQTMATTTIDTRDVVKIAVLSFPDQEGQVIVSITDWNGELRDATIFITDEFGEVKERYALYEFIKSYPFDEVKAIENHNGFDFDALDWV